MRKIEYSDEVSVDKKGNVHADYDTPPAKMFFSDERSVGGDAVVIHQPSAEEIYEEHFTNLNKSLGIQSVLESEFKGFRRQDPKKLAEEDKQNLAKRREYIDNVDRPKLEKAMRPVTDTEIDEMNKMAEQWFGAEL